jgi:hypothetical protein
MLNYYGYLLYARKKAEVTCVIYVILARSEVFKTLLCKIVIVIANRKPLIINKKYSYKTIYYINCVRIR